MPSQTPADPTGRPVLKFGGAALADGPGFRRAVEILARCDVRYATLTEAESRAAVELAAGMSHATTPSGAAGLAVAQREGASGALCLLTEGAE